MAYSLLRIHQHKLSRQKKEPIEPYLAIDGVMISDNKGSRTAFLYLSLNSIKVVKTFALIAIHFIDSKLFTLVNILVGHIYFVIFLQFFSQLFGSQISIFL